MKKITIVCTLLLALVISVISYCFKKITRFMDEVAKDISNINYELQRLTMALSEIDSKMWQRMDAVK